MGGGGSGSGFREGGSRLNADEAATVSKAREFAEDALIDHAVSLMAGGRRRRR